MKLAFMTTKQKYSINKSNTNDNLTFAEKSPAFQFYPKDVLSDGDAMAMPSEAFGIYIRLLCYDWIDDGILNDEKIFRRLGGFEPYNFQGEERNPDDWKLIYSHLIPKFTTHPIKPGFVTNPRLLKERQNQEDRRKQNKANAEKRWHGVRSATASTSHEVRIIEDDAKSYPSSSSSSSSSSSNNNNNNTRTKKVSPQRENFGLYQRVRLSNDEYQALLNDLGNEPLESLITDLDGYIESTGTSYKNHAATIRNWHRRNSKKSSSEGSKKHSYSDKWKGILSEIGRNEP